MSHNDHGKASPATDLFPETRRTIFRNLREADVDKAAEALNLLCGIYSPPLIRYSRSLGDQSADAEDFTQSFLAWWTANDLFARWEHSKGTFRSFLITCYRRFRASQWRQLNAKKRGDGRLISFDAVMEESGDAQFPAIEERARSDFDTAVAHQIFEQCFSVMRTEFCAAGKEAEFDLLRRHILDPGAPDYRNTANVLGRSPGAIKVQIHRMRKRWQVVLKQVIARCSTDRLHGAALAEEMRDLVSHGLATPAAGPETLQ